MTFDAADNPMGCDRPAVALEYAPTPQPQIRPRRLWLLVLSLPVLAVPFLSFTYTVSPLDAVRSFRQDWPIALLGIEFFVGPIIVAWRAALLILDSPRASLTRTMSVIAFLAWLPFIYICVVIANNFIVSWSSISLREFLVQSWPAYMLAAILIGGVLIIATRIGKCDKIGALTTSLTTPFLGNAALCLLGFRSDGNIGYWLTLYIFILWAMELIWDGIGPVANRFRRARRLSGPR